jgi:hypothetical protein
MMNDNQAVPHLFKIKAFPKRLKETSKLQWGQWNMCQTVPTQNANMQTHLQKTKLILHEQSTVSATKDVP